MDFPKDVRYTEQHEWVRQEGDRMRIGITDYAQDALGDVVYVDTPQVGTEVTATHTANGAGPAATSITARTIRPRRA